MNVNTVSEWQIVRIRTCPRFPGIVYAEVVDEEGDLICSATLDYCVDKIKRNLE